MNERPTLACAPVPPPAGFQPAGEVFEALVSPTPPPFIRRRRYEGRRAEGVRYEKKVQDILCEAYPTYVASPWLRFRAGAEAPWRWCQPDGLHIDCGRGIITCVEVKYQHTSNAWWQTRHLYLPVLRRLFPERLWQLQVCEIVKWFDPLVRFPEEIELTPEIARPSPRFKVHILRPR